MLLRSDLKVIKGLPLQPLQFSENLFPCFYLKLSYTTFFPKRSVQVSKWWYGTKYELEFLFETLTTS